MIMGWTKGLICADGALQGSVISVNEELRPPHISDAQLNNVLSNRYHIVGGGVSGWDAEYAMPDKNFSFPLSTTYSISYFQEDICGFKFVDDDGNTTGFLTFFATKNANTNYIQIGYKIKNASGVTITTNNSYNMGTSGKSSGIVTLHLYFGTYTWNETVIYYLGANYTYAYSGTVYGDIHNEMFTNDVLSSFGLSGVLDYDIIETSPEYGKPATAAGYGHSGNYGTFDDHSDTIGVPAKPQYGISSPGFLNVYKVSSSGLERLGTALFPQPIRVTTDVMDAVNELVANMWNSKLLDYVLDCHIIPVNPADSGSANITAGGKVLVDPETQQVYSSLRVSEDYTDFDCGAISIPEYYANFLDYNCKAKLFLPFLGFQEIKPEFWNGGTLSVKYRFNVYDGSFMCWVLSSSGKSNLQTTVVLQMSGNACIHIPLNSQSYANVLSGIITTGAGLVGAAAGGAAGAKLGATAVSGAVQIANLKPTHSQSNQYNASAAIMSVRKPYLLIEYPVAQFSTGYTNELGLPLNVYKSLGSVTGLTICDSPILNIAATDEELKELESLLKSGVIL